MSHVPTIAFAAALALAFLHNNGRPLAARMLDWMLLLPTGVAMLWAGLFHVAFPQIAAASIGWQVSPFQFEIGVSDLAVGITAVVAFWRSLPYKAAVVVYVTLFYIGVAIGHFRQAFDAGDFAPDNFGVLLLVTVLQAVLLPVLLWKTVERDRRSSPGLTRARDA